jgi:hypothetical protein
MKSIVNINTLDFVRGMSENEIRRIHRGYFLKKYLPLGFFLSPYVFFLKLFSIGQSLRFCTNRNECENRSKKMGRLQQLTQFIEEQQKVIDGLRNSSTHISKTHPSQIEIADEYYVKLQRQLEANRFELQKATLQNASLKARLNVDQDALENEKALCSKFKKIVEDLQMSITKEKLQNQELVDQVITGRVETASLIERNQVLTSTVSNLQKEICIREEILNKNLILNERSNLLNAELTKEKLRLQTENVKIQAALTTASIEIKQYRNDHSISSNFVAIHSTSEKRIQELETLVETQHEKIISQDTLISAMFKDVKRLHASQEDRKRQDHTYISLLVKKSIEQEEIISKMEKEKSIQECFILEKENMFKMLQEDYSSLQVSYTQKNNDVQRLKEDQLTLQNQTRRLKMKLKELLNSNEELSKKHIYSIKELKRVQGESAGLNSKFKM